MMTTFDQAMPARVTTPGILGRERRHERVQSLAGAACGALYPSLHGMAYGFSVFWMPLSRALGITASKSCPDMSLVEELFTTTCDWRVASMGWMFTLFFVLLGISVAIWGGWLERVGPRKAGVVAACCWSGGLVIGALGIYVHQLWLNLADMFGTQFVGAIHGRLLTAWSTAGIIGPVVVNYIREAQAAAGVPRDHLYDFTMYILCGMFSASSTTCSTIRKSMMSLKECAATSHPDLASKHPTSSLPRATAKKRCLCSASPMPLPASAPPYSMPAVRWSPLQLG